MANEAYSVDRFRKQEPPRLEPVAGRVPPSDLDAEAAVLSATLLDSEAFDAVQEILQPEHFYADANRRIYEAIVDLQIASKPVDIVSVAGHLRDKGRLDQIGGTPYLAELANATPAVAHVAAHAQVIREKWRVRQLIATCQKFAAEGYTMMLVIANAIRTAGANPTRDAIRQAIAGTRDLPGVLGQGRISIDENRVPSFGSVVLALRDGRWVQP